MDAASRVEYRQACPQCRRKGRDRSGDNLAVYADGHSYCFSCHYYIPTQSIDRLRAEAKKKERVNTIQSSDDLMWPADYIPLMDVFPNPQVAFGWLRNYGITDAEIIKYKIGWSSEHLLLIYPVFDVGNNLIMWQGRNFGEGSKYITRGPKNDVLYTVGKPDRKVLIVTEDLISAIKVGRDYQAAPLWGSEMPLGLIKKAASQFDVLGVWLDPNKVTKSVEIALRASQYLPTFVIDSAKDPKFYSSEYINQFVETAGYKRLYKEEEQDFSHQESLVVAPDKISYSDPNVDGGGHQDPDEAPMDSLERRGKMNYHATIAKLISTQPCPKCQWREPTVKAVCVIQGCPYFDQQSCEAFNTTGFCAERGCQGCMENYGEACTKTVNQPERPWDYKREASGS